MAGERPALGINWRTRNPSAPTATSGSSPPTGKEDEAMTAQALRGALGAKPFREFRIVFTDCRDDREVWVPHPDYVSLSPSDERTVIIHRKGGGLHIVDLDCVGDFEFRPLSEGKKK